MAQGTFLQALRKEAALSGTRQRLSFGSSNLFLLWGYLLAATTIVIFEIGRAHV